MTEKFEKNQRNDTSPEDVVISYIIRDLDALKLEMRTGFANITKEIRELMVPRREFDEKIKALDKKIDDKHQLINEKVEDKHKLIEEKIDERSVALEEKIKNLRTIFVYVGSAIGISLIGALMKLILNI